MVRRGVPLLFAVVLSLPLLTAAPSAAALVAACPDAYPVGEVGPGLVGTGTGVFDAAGQRPFTARVLGVLEGATQPGSDLILAELSGPVIDAAGSVPFGLSGAPVMVGDRLLGAVAWGVTFGPSRLVGLTPGQDIIDLARLEMLPMTSGTDRVSVTAKDGGPAQLAPLPVPLQVSGLGAARLPVLQQLMDDRGLALVPLQGSAAARPSASAIPASVAAGEGVAAVLSYGDITSAAFGHLTYLCDGDAIAFAHPLTFLGATTLGANRSEPVAVVPDPLYGPSLVSRIGSPVGTVTQDRWAGLRIDLGPAPSVVPIRSTVRSLETGRARTGSSEVVARDELPWIAQAHVASNLQIVADRYGAGGAELAYTIRGTADGRAWSLERTNRHLSSYDISWQAAEELLGTLGQLTRSALADVEISDIAVTGAVTPEAIRYRIEEVLVGRGAAASRLVSLEVVPGDLVPLRLRLGAVPAGPDIVVDLDLPVPADAPLGFGSLEISGGPASRPDPYECMWNPDGCPAPGGVESFDELLTAIATAPRNDDVVARMTMETGSEPPSDDWAFAASSDGGTLTTIEARARVERVVEGSWLAQVTVASEHFDDVWSSAHRTAIEQLASEGVTTGCGYRRFCPAGEVTRGQAASLLSRGFEIPEAGEAPAASFVDLPGDHPHAASIRALTQAGIVTGFGDGTVRPGAPVTRGQLALMLARALDLEGGTDATFRDVAAGSPLSQAVRALADAGVVRGYADGTFRPGEVVTRGAGASLLVRALEIIP